MSYQISKSTSSSWEIFDEKKLTDRQTDILTEKAKTIYPLYTSYTGGGGGGGGGRQF